MAGHQVWILLVWIFTIHTLDTAWILGNGTLPREDKNMAAGLWNDSIFIVGGYSNDYQLTEYQISTNTFIDLGINALSEAIEDQGQFWVQKKEFLYLIPPQATYLAVFNMETKQIISPWKNLTLSPQPNYGCLAIADEYLFVVGGKDYGVLYTMNALSLQTYAWINNTPSMINKRYYNACVHHRDLLCTFGGYSGSLPMMESECLNTSDITQNTWSVIAPLTHNVYKNRALASSHYMFILGGFNAQGSNKYKDSMHIYDMNSNTMTLSADTLSYAISLHATIVAHDIIYIFGGYDGWSSNQWMYYDLATKDLTTNPSAAPSANTKSPAYPPTQIPSTFTQSPIRNPSVNPSVHPTETSSVTSTNNPSFTPITETLSKAPTKNPTFVSPNIGPTNYVDETTVDIQNNYNHDDNPQSVGLSLWMIVGLFIISCCCCVLFIGGCISCYNRQNITRNKVYVIEAIKKDNKDIQVHNGEESGSIDHDIVADNVELDASDTENEKSLHDNSSSQCGVTEEGVADDVTETPNM